MRDEAPTGKGGRAYEGGIACWKRIGVWGNGTCVELQEHVHCRNCPVYSAAAVGLLDAQAPLDYSAEWTSHFAQAQVEREVDTDSLVLFRVGTDWLALPTPLFLEVGERRPIRTLPHRRDSAVVGLVNVRGELLICMMLERILGYTELPSFRELQQRPRFLVVEGEDGRLVFPVDEVRGVHRHHANQLEPAPATVSRDTASHVLGMMAVDGVRAAVLDAPAMLEAAGRSLG